MSTTWPALSFSEANDYKLDTSCSYMSNDCLVEWRMPTPHTCTSIIKWDKRFVPKLQLLALQRKELSGLAWGTPSTITFFYQKGMQSPYFIPLPQDSGPTSGMFTPRIWCLKHCLHCCMIGVDAHSVPIQVRVETHIIAHVTARSVELVVVSFWGRKCPASTT